MRLLFLLLPACSFERLPDDTGTFGGATTVASLPSGTITVAGTGTEGHWTGYERADRTCTQAGGSYARDCEIDFTVAQAADGSLTVTLVDYEPDSSWLREDLLAYVLGDPMPVGTDAPAATTISDGPYGWQVELFLDADGLHFDLAGEYDSLSRCSGERLTMVCSATWEDPSLADVLSPVQGLGDLEAGDLVLTELLADPTACTDSQAEWVEVQNVTARPVDLAGLVLVDAAGNASTLDGSVVLEPAAFAVLGRGALAGFCDPSLAPDAGTSGTLSLNNGGDTVQLLAGAVVLDATSYPAVRGGEAWSRDAVGAWCASTATPGAAGADCPGAAPAPDEESGSDASDAGSGGGAGGVLTVADLRVGDLIVSEVMCDPAAVSDSAGEWFEVTNLASASVDLAGLQVRDVAGSTATLASHVLAPGASAWFGRGSSTSWGYASAPTAYYGSSPALNNGGEQLWLTAGGVDIDATPTLGASAGRSTQRDPATGAWCTSTSAWSAGDQGTPGTMNHACP